MEHLEYLKRSIELSGRMKENPGNFQGAYVELAKLEVNKACGCRRYEIDYSSMDRGLERIRLRMDCADFVIPAFVRILLEFGTSKELEETYVRRIEDTLLGFKYWLDEPGDITGCYFTENHQILFHSAEYLTGLLFPDRVFSNNNKSGAWHREHAVTFIRRWLSWRSRFGFAEWLSQGYYAEDLLALAGLAHYAKEEDIRVKSKLLMDLLMFDLACNSFHGHLGGTHGRAYTKPLTNPGYESVGPVMKLAWDEGDMEQEVSSCGILLASYGYHCPQAIRETARVTGEWIHKQRVSMEVKDAKSYGIDPSDFDNIMFFWGMQTYSDREVIDHSLKVFPIYNWMYNRMYAYKERYELLDKAGLPAPETPDFTAMTQADIYTYRTEDYMLGCVQDYRKGRRGFQQHVWTASLGGKALVFTNVPGSFDYNCRPNQFAGNLFLPRAVINKNVVLCIYRIDADFIDFQYTHAYFPQDEFDEVKEAYGWVFGKKNRAYIALRSMRPAKWEPVNPEFYRYVSPGDWEKKATDARPFEYSAQGHANVWAAEMGSEKENGSFEQFICQFEHAELTGDTFRCTYLSPSQGRMEFGWLMPFKIEGREIDIHDYPRYENAACYAEFDGGKVEIKKNGHFTCLDFENLRYVDE